MKDPLHHDHYLSSSCMIKYMVMHDQTWSRMIKNDHKWSSKITNDQEWSQMIKNDHKWSSKITNDQVRCMNEQIFQKWMKKKKRGES